MNTTAHDATRAELLTRLQTLDPVQLEVLDESHLHAGHAGARSGGGHFSVTIVTQRFAGLSTLARHRLVMDAAGELMQTRIHALSIRAFTPETG